MVIFHGYVRFIFADLLSGPHHVADALSSFWTYLVPNDLNWLILLLGLKGQHESKGRTDRVNLVITSMYFLPSGLGLFAPRQDLSRVWPDPSGAAFLGRRSKRFWHCIGQAAQAKLDEISPSNHRSMCGWSPAATYGGKAVASCELLSQKSGSVCICICIYIYMCVYVYVYVYIYKYYLLSVGKSQPCPVSVWDRMCVCGRVWVVSRSSTTRLSGNPFPTGVELKCPVLLGESTISQDRAGTLSQPCPITPAMVSFKHCLW